jgi:predicted ATPase
VPESVLSFQSLPVEYQSVIKLAEQRHRIAITPLQKLTGGLSGAMLYLVRVASIDSGSVEHLILKLDRAHPKASSDEVTRHKTVKDRSPPAFTREHIPEIAFDRAEHDGALAILYTIAGQSLHDFRTLSSYRRQSRLKRLFSATNRILLDEWNAGLAFETKPHPRELLTRWLGFRLDAGQKIEAFLGEVCRLPHDTPGFLVEGNLLPNPLAYARNSESWGTVRAMDAAMGLQHSDLNTNNLLAKFARQGDELEGYYLIDFALFKEGMPLFFDQRYLEMSYLVHALASASFSSVVDLIVRYSEHDLLEIDQAPVELSGVNATVRSGRQAFGDWVRENHPSLHDDLWGQYWLAGAAAGLGYCHKAGIADEPRLAGLIYAAANLNQFFKLFEIPIPTEAGQLYTKAQIDRSAATMTLSEQEARQVLPVPPTNFIGRAAELEELTELLLRPEVRLVSLTGPGGTGKTRLALEAARRLEKEFPQGAFFIDLAGLRDPARVVPTAAHTLGFREGGGQAPLQKLKDFLASREMLLIFDNFEQVAEAAMDLSELLAGAPGFKALVTSRVSLQLRTEHEYPVSPLEMPPDLDLALDKTITYESMALLLQQARAVRPGFEITKENQSALVEICRRLDGLPLAIEIAAARIKMLTPEALLKRLDQSLGFLVSPAKDIPDRQQTLSGTIDWSYQLLDPEVQRLFARLGIFAGGFTLEAAQAICPSMDELDVFHGIETLLNNSLLRRVDSVTEEPRFDMLQTIREFALEKAVEAGLMEELHRTHCYYFTALAGRGMEGGIYGPDSVLWMNIYEQEHDNYRLTMTWALEHPEEGVQPMIVILNQLTWFWYRYGYLQEGSEWTERALKATEPMGESLARAYALAARGSLALWSGDLLLAAQRTKEAMEMGQRLNLDPVYALTKMTYGTTLVNQGRDKEAYPHLVDSIELYDDQDQRWLKGIALVHLANVSLGLGDPEQALRWLDTAKPLLNASGDVWTMAFGLNNYGEVARAQGDYESAEEYYRRTEALYKQADAKGDQARLSTALGYIARHKGEYDQAQDLFLESLDEFRKLGNQRGIAECLGGLAGLAAERGEHAWAAPLLGAADALLQDIEGAWWPADRVEIDRAKKRTQEALGEEYEALRAQGGTMPIDEAIAYAAGGW